MNNSYEVRGDVVAIFLNGAKREKVETIIDLSDFELVSSQDVTWYAWMEKTIGNITLLVVLKELMELESL